MMAGAAKLATSDNIYPPVELLAHEIRATPLGTASELLGLAERLVYADKPSDEVMRARAYFFTAAWRTHYDLLRKKSRETFLVDEETVDKNPGPQDAMEADELAEALRKALRELSEMQRNIVFLSAFGMSHSEIADAIGEKPPAVRQSFRRAKRKLAKALKRALSE